MVIFNSSSKAEMIVNESDIYDVFKSIYTTIITNIQKSLGKGSGWIIDSVFDYTISIFLKHNSLARSSYIKLPKELDHPRKRLINIQNTDVNECFKWCSVRYLYPADCNPARIPKADKDVAKIIDFKDIKFPVKTRTFTKLRKRIKLALAFLVMKTKQNIQSMYQKNAVKINLLIYY